MKYLLRRFLTRYRRAGGLHPRRWRRLREQERAWESRLNRNGAK